MFKGYKKAGFYKETLAMFREMKKRDVEPNEYTFTFVIKSCAMIPAWREGEEVHCFAIKSGFGSNMFVGTLLIDMYSSGGVMESACKVFDTMPVRNVVAWTAIVAAYLSIGDIKSARRLFDQSVERDIILWNTMVVGYTACGDMAAAMELFVQMPDRDVMSWNTVLNGFANKDVEACENFFDEMPERNVFSWNGLIGGYAHHGRFFEVLSAFNWMLKWSNVAPNDATLVMVLSACSKLGALKLGRWIHVYAESNGFKGNVYVGNVLIDMYAKCGCIENAVDVFNGMNTRDLITWNAIIGGLAMHGRGKEALKIFDQMKDAGERPDGITFVGALCACVHMGLVQAGLDYFRSMAEEFSIAPWIEHYGCIVDLLGRVGLLNEALDFVRKMPIKPDCVIWSTLLGACQVHRNVSLGELAMNQLIRLGPEDVTSYVVLSNIYGDVGRWKDVARLKLMIRDMSVEKLPGCSLIEVDSEVIKFYSSDVSHPQTWEIYGVLGGLKELLKSVECEPELGGLCEGT